MLRELQVLVSSPNILPENRRYDTPELFREDTLTHIHQVEPEVAKHELDIQAILTERKERERID